MFEINLIGKSGFGAKGERFGLPCVVTYILNGVHRVRELTLTCDSVDQLK